MSTLPPPPTWEPSLYQDGDFGKFGNTYRAILSLSVGDNLDLAKVIEGAPNLKSAYVWRTKDGWEFRVASYSGVYGFSIEPDELKEDKGLFDTILKSADIDPPFPDADKCACGCGSPSKKEYLPGHEDRYDLQPNPIIPVEDEEEQPDAEVAKVAPTLPEEEDDEPQGENVPDTEPEVETPDAAQSPELPAAEPRRKDADAYSKYLAKAVVNTQEVAEETSEPQDDELVAQPDLDAYLDGLVSPTSYVPSDDEFVLAIELAGIRDEFVGQDPYPGTDKCACGCGGAAPRFGNYLVGHDLRHRSWLMKRIKQGDGHAFEAFKSLGWLRYLYPDFRLPGDFGPEDRTLQRVQKSVKDDIKPSYNRKHLYKLAYKLVLADAGYYSDQASLAGLDARQSDKLRSLWRKKEEYLRQSEIIMDSVDVSGSLVDVAGQVYVTVIRRAVEAGFKDLNYQGFVRFPDGSKNFSPGKVRKREDTESLSLVSEPLYTRYRDSLEFEGQEFDIQAKFFNYLAMKIANGNKPDWVESEASDPWMAAAESISNLPPRADSFMAQWWLEHGHKASAASPPTDFMAIAKGIIDFTATHERDIVENVKSKYQKGDKVIVSVSNPKKRVLWYNDFLMEVTRVIEGQVYGRLRMNDNNLSDNRWKESANLAGLIDDSDPKEVKIDSDQIIWLSPK